MNVDYGLSGTYGFRPENPLFATDASWATVVGESGVIGAIFVLFALGALWIHLFRHAREGRGQGFRLAALMFASVRPHRFTCESAAFRRVRLCRSWGACIPGGPDIGSNSSPRRACNIPTSASGRSEESRA